VALDTGGGALPLSVLIVGSFMSVLDTSIVNVAVPKIQIELGAAPTTSSGSSPATRWRSGIVVPLSGWLGMRLGQTRLYILSRWSASPAASALCGLAWNLNR
jgi:MFS family permease